MLIIMDRVIIKRILELLTGNSRFLIHNLLNLFVAEIVKALDLNNLGWPNRLATVFSRLNRL